MPVHCPLTINQTLGFPLGATYRVKNNQPTLITSSLVYFPQKTNIPAQNALSIRPPVFFYNASLVIVEVSMMHCMAWCRTGGIMLRLETGEWANERRCPSWREGDEQDVIHLWLAPRNYSVKECNSLIMSRALDRRTDRQTAVACGCI